MRRQDQLSPIRERRSNDTHRSTTDPDARLAKKGKGKEARLRFGAHVLMDNREGLVVDVRLTPADGTSERDAALEIMVRAPSRRRITVGSGRKLRYCEVVRNRFWMEMTTAS